MHRRLFSLYSRITQDISYKLTHLFTFLSWKPICPSLTLLTLWLKKRRRSKEALEKELAKILTLYKSHNNQALFWSCWRILMVSHRLAVQIILILITIQKKCIHLPPDWHLFHKQVLKVRGINSCNLYSRNTAKWCRVFLFIVFTFIVTGQNMPFSYCKHNVV